MVSNERDLRHEHVLMVAGMMMTAARTAPKGRGVDIVEVAMADGNSLKQLASKMIDIGEKRERPSFVRDAGNVLQSECVVIIGTRAESLGLNCSHCGFPACADKPTEIPCSINAIDVGIAVGSACATAADCRVDTRVMYSVGAAAQELGWLGDAKLVMGIVLSASSKNPFFDRNK